MASVIDICNVALSQIRSGSINSLTEGSAQSQQCSLHYEIARDQVMTEVDWGFNRKIAALAQLSSVTIFNWSYIWQMPSDCLFINRLIRNVEEVSSGVGSTPPSRVYDPGLSRLDDLPPVEYRTFNVSGTRVIASKEKELRIDYRSRITDPNLMSVDARDAISFLLAARMAMPLAGAKDGRVFRADCLELYAALKTRAEDQNSNQEQLEQPESEFITVRG